jgi:hypothetical protein
MEKCSEPKFRAAVQNQGVEPGSGLRSAVNPGIYTTGLGKDKKATTEGIAVRVRGATKVSFCGDENNAHTGGQQRHRHDFYRQRDNLVLLLITDGAAKCGMIIEPVVEAGRTF